MKPEELEQAKNRVAVSKGYPDWKTMESWLIDHNISVVVGQLLVSAMEEASCLLLSQHREMVMEEVKMSWTDVKNKYMEFHHIDEFTENMAIDVDFGFWLIEQLTGK
jgi:hypothetical protein